MGGNAEQPAQVDAADQRGYCNGRLIPAAQLSGTVRRVPMAKRRELPLRLDTEAFVLGFYVVLDVNYKFVREFETIEEAEVFIAEANGSDVETVQRDAQEQAQMLHEYRENLRRHLKQSVKRDGRS